MPPENYCPLVAQLCLTLYDPTDYSPPGSSVHGDSPCKNTGMCCHSLLHARTEACNEFKSLYFLTDKYHVCPMFITLSSQLQNIRVKIVSVLGTLTHVPSICEVLLVFLYSNSMKTVFRGKIHFHSECWKSRSSSTK